jgi:hypothetical protein
MMSPQLSVSMARTYAPINRLRAQTTASTARVRPEDAGDEERAAAELGKRERRLSRGEKWSCGVGDSTTRT